MPPFLNSLLRLRYKAIKEGAERRDETINKNKTLLTLVSTLIRHRQCVSRLPPLPLTPARFPLPFVLFGYLRESGLRINVRLSARAFALLALLVGLRLFLFPCPQQTRSIFPSRVVLSPRRRHHRLRCCSSLRLAAVVFSAPVAIPLHASREKPAREKYQPRFRGI